jgi:hypothetical protein
VSQAITTLDLGSNRIGDEGTQRVFAALQNNTVNCILFSAHLTFNSTQTLVTLNISSNQISAIGVKYCAQAIGSIKVNLICTLQIHHTGLISCTQTLLKLDLSYNQMGAVGAQNLAATLGINTVMALSLLSSHLHLYFTNRL